MQHAFRRFFSSDSALMGAVVCSMLLWVANAVFNVIAQDYMSCFIDLMFVVCLITLGGAAFKNEQSVTQGMVGALMMLTLLGSVNVMNEQLTEVIPSRSRWQLIFGLALALALFVNHFMISSTKYHRRHRIVINQLLILALLIFRCIQIVLNIAQGEMTSTMIEIIVGMLALIPTLDAIVCIEMRNGAYSLDTY